MKYGRHGKSGDEWRLVSPSGNVANIPLLLLLLCSASLIIIGLRSSSPFDSTLSVSSVSTSPPSSPRLLFLLLIFPSAKIFFHFIPSSRFRDLAFRGEKKIWPKESSSKTKRFQLLDKGYLRSCVWMWAWKFRRKEERCRFSIFYEFQIRACGTIRFNIWTMRAPEIISDDEDTLSEALLVPSSGERG